MDMAYHAVVRHPECPVCGTPRQPSDGSVRFGAQPICSSRDSGKRRDPPDVTFERYQHHISPVTGVVREVIPSPWNQHSPLRSYSSGHNMALGGANLGALKEGLRTFSSGKGRTNSQARTSALCEALERYSGVFHGDEVRVKESSASLGDKAIHPNRCMLYSDRQYAERERWMARASRFQVVPLPHPDDAVVDWSPLWSLTQQRTRYLPTNYLYYSYPTPPHQFFAWADSNGCAAGSSLEDACLQALHEIVERDAVAIWWYNRHQPAGVDLDSFDDPYLQDLQSWYASIGRTLHVLDLTHDLGVPVFAAIGRRVSGPTEDIIMGFGAHDDPVIALNRAVTEMNQFMPAVLSVAPDGATRYAFDDPDALHWWQTATVAAETHLMPDPALPLRTLTPQADTGGDLLERLTSLMGRLEARGMEVLVLDQTRPEIGLPVAKVVVPGMRHFWARFAPGRLYDVPVELGWRGPVSTMAFPSRGWASRPTSRTS